MGNLTVLFDACVLYPAPLRDFLMHLAVADLFRAHWSDAIHDEWIGSLLSDRPDLRIEDLERTRSLMNAHVRDCLVTGFEPLIETVMLPDPDDRHVLAAAIHVGANVILTFNLEDFPETVLARFGIEAQHPDYLLARQLDLAPEIVCVAAKRHRESLKNPPKSAEAYLTTLTAQGLPQTAAGLRRRADLI